MCSLGRWYYKAPKVIITGRGDFLSSQTCHLNSVKLNVSAEWSTEDELEKGKHPKDFFSRQGEIRQIKVDRNEIVATNRDVG